MRTLVPAALHVAPLLLTAALLGPDPSAASPEPFTEVDPWVSGHFQVAAEPGLDIDAIATEHGLVVVDTFDRYHLLASSGEVDDGVCLAALQSDPRLDWAEMAYRQHTPESARQMVVAVVGATVDEFVTQDVYDWLGLATIHSHTRGDDVVVAVVDTGIDRNHPALRRQVLPVGYDFVDGDDDPNDSANGLDDDGDGTIDEAAGHGTMVAGIVALSAPRASLLAIRALDDEGSGTAFGVARAIHYAIEHGADVINLSLGLPAFSQIIDAAIQAAHQAGVVVVAAAGNDATDDPAFFPASSPLTVSVASTDQIDIKSDFSNYHETVTVCAPGEAILAPYREGSFAVGSGTSFAAPFISGQAALVLSYAPLLGKDGVESKIRDGVVHIDHLIGNVPYQGKLGSGRFDAGRTWELLEPTLSAIPTPTELQGDAMQWVPNPLPAGTTTLLDSGSLEGSVAAIAVTVHDAAGRLVRALAPSSAGAVAWDGRTEAGRAVAPGVYFTRARLLDPSGHEIARTTARLQVVAR